jgi:hypothetical protein
MLSLKYHLGARELPGLRVAERKRIFYDGHPLTFFIPLVPFALRHHARTLAESRPGKYENGHRRDVIFVTSLV